MILAKVKVTDVCAKVLYSLPIPAGIVGATVNIEYADAVWAGLNKTIVFRCSNVIRDVISNDSIVRIPAEVLEKPGRSLQIGFYGVDTQNNLVIPTLWADMGRVTHSAEPGGDTSSDPALPVWAQLQAMIGNLDNLSTEDKSNLVAAINELHGKVGQITTDVDTLDEVLTTFAEALRNHSETTAEQIGNPDELLTTEKNSLVAAINEVAGRDFEIDEARMAEIVAEVLADPEVKKIQKNITDLQSDIADLKYVAIDITKITNNVGTREMGSEVSEVTVSWTLNKAPESQTLAGEAVDVAARSKTIPGPFTESKSFALEVTDERGATDSASTSISFLNGVYYGVLEDGAELDSVAILTLTRKLQGSKALTFEATAGATQRFVYALPTRYGTPAFKDVETGFKADFYKATEVPIAFTNGSGYTENYDVWLSTNIIPKKKTFSVS